MEVGAFYLRHAPTPRGRYRLERLLTRIGSGALHRYRARPDITFDLDLRDLIQSMILYRGGYESGVLELLERLLPAGGAFLDVGANIGLHTLVASRRVGPDGRVHAIEPEPECRRRLQHHLALNRISNVEVFPYALSDHEGTARLFKSPPENSAKASFVESNTTMGLSGRSPGFVDVPTRTLDQHVAGWVRTPDVVKIDVEGAELLVVRGGRAILAGDDAPAVLFEASDLQTRPLGYDTRELKSALASHGYQVFRYGRSGLEPVAAEEGHRLEDLVALKHSHLGRAGLVPPATTVGT